MKSLRLLSCICLAALVLCALAGCTTVVVMGPDRIASGTRADDTSAPERESFAEPSESEAPEVTAQPTDAAEPSSEEGTDVPDPTAETLPSEDPGTEESDAESPENPEGPGTEESDAESSENPDDPGTEAADAERSESPEDPGTEETDAENPAEPSGEDVPVETGTPGEG